MPKTDLAESEKQKNHLIWSLLVHTYTVYNKLKD